MNDRARGSRVRFRGLRVQIVLWMVLPLTLVLIGVAFTGVYSHEQAMRSLVAQRDRALAVITAGQVRDLLEVRTRALSALAAGQPFYHRDQPAQTARLAEAGDLGGLFVDLVALLDGAGNVVAGVTPPPAWTTDTRLVSQVPALLEWREAYLTPPVDTPLGDDRMVVTVPVHDEAGEVYAVLAGPVSLQSLDLRGLFNQVQIGEEAAMYLVDASGQILAHSPPDRARTSLAGHTGLGVALQSTGAATTLCQAPDGERMTLAYAPVDFAHQDWRVLIEQPWHQVIGPVLRYSQFMPLVAALAALVALLTLYYGVSSIVRPLQDLGRRAERVAWGDFEAIHAPVGGVEEIEELRRTLDQMAKRIQSYQRGMHDYIAAITRGQEDERRRLARELHDDTAQSLIALRQQVELAQKMLAADAHRAADAVRSLDQVRAQLAETLDGVRRFSRDLRPIYLEDLGFIPALEMLAGEVDRREPLSVQFAVIGAVRRLSPELELAAYRIVQEALNNTIHHAAAARAWIEVRFEPDHLLLSVRDDGRGFDAPDLPDALARQGHFGLMGIQERALLFGGQLLIHSSPGQGAAVTVRLPYPPN